MWRITTFTGDNRPLRVIPGSHRVSRPPMDMSEEAFDDPGSAEGNNE